MSWYRDPELFIYYWDSSYGYGIGRIVKKYNVPLNHGDITYDEGQLDFSKHLSLGNNKESDYAALKSHLVKNVDVITHENVKYVNCQGLVVNWAYKKSSGTWSRVEELYSIFYSLPGITNPSETVLLAEKRAAEEKNGELVAENSILKGKLHNEVTNLQEQLIQERNAKQALQAQVFDLTAKLKECRGAGAVSATWMSGDIVPSHLVPFDDLDVLKFPKDTRVTITEGPSKPRFAQDVTTNVQLNRFYRGTLIVAVNVEELIPDNEKARFDPDIWGVYTIEGIRYAARKPLETETSVSPHKTS